MPWWRRNVSTTCSPSFWRISPVSTNTQVSWAPTARWTSAAATAESTPPTARTPGARRPPVPGRSRPGFDDRARCPGRRGTHRVVEEVLQHLLAVGGVHHLGMELHPEAAAVDVLQGGHGDIGGGGGDGEPLGGHRDGVEVAHPHLLVRGLGRAEEEARTGHVQIGAPVLAPPGVGHLAAQLEGHQLGAIADAQDGDAEVEDRRVEPGGALDVDRLGPTAQDQARRGALGDLGRGDRVWGTISL